MSDRLSGQMVELVVIGAHMRDLPLNPQLVDLGGRFLDEVLTAPVYRLYALVTDPPKPGLLRVGAGGGAVLGERWSLPEAGLGRLVATLPSPMTIGSVQLVDTRLVPGFLVEPAAIVDAVDITAHGGWRHFLAATSAPV